MCPIFLPVLGMFSRGLMKMILKDKLKEFVNFIDDPPKGKRDSILLRLTDQIFYAFGETPDRINRGQTPMKHTIILRQGDLFLRILLVCVGG